MWPGQVGVDRLADLADDVARNPEVRRGVQVFGVLVGVQMVIGIVISIVALIFFIVIATKVIGSFGDANNDDFNGLGTVQVIQR